MLLWAWIAAVGWAATRNLREINVKQPVGLINIGNTCFVNAVLQSLYTHPLFRQALLDCPAVQKESLSAEVSVRDSQQWVNALRAVFSRLTVAAPGEVVNIEPDLYHCIRENGLILKDSGVEGDLQGFDAQEIFAMILEKLPMHLREMFRFAKMEVTEQGDQLHQVMNVPLALEPQVGLVELGGRRLGNHGSLEAILSDTKIKTLPPILTVCLSRAHYFEDKKGWKSTVQAKAISYPFAFEMHGANAEELGGQVTYRLFAVIVHTGEYHYLAYVRRKNNWYYVNDSQVRTVSRETVLKEQHRWVAVLYDRTNFEVGNVLLEEQDYQDARAMEAGYERLTQEKTLSRIKPVVVSKRY